MVNSVLRMSSPGCQDAHCWAEWFYLRLRGWLVDDALSVTKVVHVAKSQMVAVRSRSALAMTETELNAIAALATIGLSSSPNHG